MTKQFSTIRWQLNGRRPGTFSQWHIVEGHNAWTACQRLIPLVWLTPEQIEHCDGEPTCKLCRKKVS